jgi:hypothetical protein
VHQEKQTSLGMRFLIGEHIKLIGKHPHSGKTGIVKKVDKLKGIGYAMLVALDEGESCYVFDLENTKKI